jgi:sulfate permease, SulP family
MTRRGQQLEGPVLGTLAGGLKVLIVRLDKVPVMDATGLVALESAISTLTKNGCLTILVGLQLQPAQLVERAGLQHGRSRVGICSDLAAGMTAAREAISASR